MAHYHHCTAHQPDRTPASLQPDRAHHQHQGEGTPATASPDPAADPISALLALADLATTGRPLPTALGRWLADGIRSTLIDGRSLQQALGLSSIHRSPRSAVAHARRNAALAAAGQALDGDTQALAAMVARSHGQRYHRHRERLEALSREQRDQAQRYIDQALAAGAPLPTGDRQLYRILRGETRCPDLPPSLAESLGGVRPILRPVLPRRGMATEN
ncbi:MAG: hypothetical protein C1943_03845 [Halochromatium sp.]|nr:hypothetical protein [Halochromatium sp.]